MKLWRYIQGYRKGKDAHKLEKEAMSDPFLAHALRGFDRVEGDHARQIEQLKKNVRGKQINNRIYYFRAAGIAASILLVVGLGTYFIINETTVPDNLPLAVFHELKPEELPTPPQPIIAQQKQVEVTNARTAPQVEETLEIDQSEEITEMPVAAIAPVEREMQTIVAEEPISVSVDSEAVVKEEVIRIRGMSDIKKKPVELDEVVVTGYQTQKKQVLTGAVAGVSVNKNKAVMGRVTDQQGEPIIGASVQVEGTNNGTVTNTEGYFWLQAADSSKIRVNYIGYESLEKMFNENDFMEFAMNEDQATLDEVVVVGYGTQHKSKSVLREPKPVDGMRKYKKYLKENMVRPTDSECGEAKGKVVLSFHVNQDGRPERITVKESLCASADEEAIRLVTEGPDWKSGEKAVTLEVEF